MLFGIEFRDEQDKSELVEKAQRAKEAVCDLWEKMAEHMPELHQLQERRYYNRGGALVGGQGYQMGNPSGWNGSHLGYRDYGMNANGGSYRDGGYGMGGYGPSMGGYGGYRENPAYTGAGDRRGY